MEYKYKKESELSFEDTVLRTKDELSKEGFGVLTEIDVRTTLKTKLGVEYGNYIILGVCNPSLAHQALLAEKEVGLFMPCNVIIYEENSKSFVSAMMPTVALQAISNPTIEKIAKQAEEKLKKVVDNIKNNN
jgi:uncharacterized protein (DUF302 family)